MTQHNFWKESFWEDIVHCLCCECGNGAFPLSKVKAQPGARGAWCDYSSNCRMYDETEILFLTLTNTFIAWKEKDYDEWCIYRSENWKHPIPDRFTRSGVPATYEDREVYVEPVHWQTKEK